MWSKKLLVLFSLLLFNAVLSQDLVKKENTYRTKINREFSVEADGTLKIKGVTGDISVESWSKSKVQIEEKITLEVYTKDEAEKIIQLINANYSQDGNTVTIKGVNGNSSIKRTFVIKVPEKFNLAIATNGGNLKTKSMTGNISLKTSGGNIQIEKIVGSVELKTAGGNLFLIGIDGPLNAKTSGGNIQLSQLTGKGNVKTSGGNIQVTDARSDISVVTSGGNISIESSGGNLNAKTSGGNLKVLSCTGNAKLHTSGGNIILKNMGGTVDAHTSGGDIQGHTFSQKTSLHTSGGNIELENVQAAIAAKTSGGDITLNFTLSDFSKPHSIELATSAGNIDLTLPAKIPASISAEIRLDKHHKSPEKYEITSDFPLTQKRIEKEGKLILQARGDINDGDAASRGDTITLRTSAGNIRIHKK